MRYRVVIVNSKENGHTLYYRAEYRTWWGLFWKPVTTEDPRGKAYDFGNALRAIARTLLRPGGQIVISEEFV